MRLTMPWNTTEQNHNGNGYSEKLEELRAALGKEVDHVAKVASQLSQDLGAQARAAGTEATEQAATAEKDVQSNASGIASKIVGGAAALGPAIALMGRKRAETLANDVQSLGQDLRRVRLTTEPRRATPDFMPGITLLGGFGAGIALMYFLDPERGPNRRALLRDQFNKWTRLGREAASSKAKDLREAAGAAIEARKAVVTIEPEPETQPFETYAYGSTQTPESPESAERETSQTVG
ncbi:MAG: hypothetical protein ABI797_06580 [Chloroflexota bacterium]